MSDIPARSRPVAAEGWRGGEASGGRTEGSTSEVRSDRTPQPGTRKQWHRSAEGWRGGAIGLALLALCSCVEVPVDRLFALRLEKPPDERAWSATLPLPLKSGGGSIHGTNPRLAELELDTDAVHLGSASCHHGPPIASPVPGEARAFYTGRELFLDVRWEDPTKDTVPRAWAKGPAGWRLGESDEDGIAILWSRAAGPFGCQEACHMRDFAIRQGELVDQRAMFLVNEGDWEETWIWKPSQGAQALTLGPQGFLTSRGEVYRTLNSAAAADTSLTPEARRAATFGTDDRPISDGAGRPLQDGDASAPAYRYAPDPSRGGLTAVAERTRRGWRVLFSRALEAGPGRQRFRGGESHPFGVAIFDATSVNHHIVRDTKTLKLIAPAMSAPPSGEVPAGVL